MIATRSKLAGYRIRARQGDLRDTLETASRRCRRARRSGDIAPEGGSADPHRVSIATRSRSNKPAFLTILTTRRASGGKREGPSWQFVEDVRSVGVRIQKSVRDSEVMFPIEGDVAERRGAANP
jgi:hypothetical protein